jgi:hypothetical protein
VRDGNFSFVITGVERIDVFSDGVTVGLERDRTSGLARQTARMYPL